MSSGAPRIAVRAVVFDLDGVLVDSEHVNVSSARDAFALHGVRLPEDAGARIVGRHPADYVLEFAREAGLDARQVESLRRFQDGLYRERWATGVRLVEGAPEVLASLARDGVRLAVATSAGREHLEGCLARFDLVGRFEVLVSMSDVRRRKPDPEAYRLALARLGLPPGEAVAVEDSPHGVDAALGAGMRVLAVRTAAVPADRIAHADRLLGALPEVLDAVVAARLR